ncbi:MAG TPA: hypothetical protein V6C86_26280 [Oculatellaceae cyanobacterium]
MAIEFTNPKFAFSSMEDGLVDVVVMNLILFKVSEDKRREQIEKSLKAWAGIKHLHNPNQDGAESDLGCSRN